MSVSIMNRVWRHSQAAQVDRLVLLALADHADDDGVCWPGIQSLALKCRVSGRTVQRSIRALQEMGELAVEHGSGIAVSGGSTNRYCILTPRQSDTPSECHPVTNQAKGGDKGVMGGGDKGVTQTVSSNHQESSIEEEESESPDFHEIVDFWNSQTGLPKIQKLTDGRKRHLKARLDDSFFRDNWKAAIERITKSNFCSGVNERGWKADFDWFLKPDTITKVVEGKYDDRNPSKSSGDKRTSRFSWGKTEAETIL